MLNVLEAIVKQRGHMNISENHNDIDNFYKLIKIHIYYAYISPNLTLSNKKMTKKQDHHKKIPLNKNKKVS